MKPLNGMVKTWDLYIIGGNDSSSHENNVIVTTVNHAGMYLGMYIPNRGMVICKQSDIFVPLMGSCLGGVITD